MPIGGTRQSNVVAGSAYRKDPLYAYAESFKEAANLILNENGYDIFEEPQRVMRKSASKNIMKKFFVENMIDTNNPMYDAKDIDDQRLMAEAQFDNDVEAMLEHSAPADLAPVVGMSLPIHKFILMNNVYDKGGIQKVTAVQPQFTISLERLMLVKPDGTEIDMFLQQNEIAAAINSTNPEKIIELTLPVAEDLDIVGTYFGGSSLDNLDVSTRIVALEMEGVQINVGDIKPDENGYLLRNGEVATEDSVETVWFPVDIRFAANYGGPNHFDRAVTAPYTLTFKDGNNSGAVTSKRAIITGTMNKNRFNIQDLAGVVKKVRLAAKLDSSSAMMETCSTKWDVTTSWVEIGNRPAINTTISPNEVKDIAAMYNVNQLTKTMSQFKIAMSEYKDSEIKRNLDESYKRLDERRGGYGEFDFAPPAEYALTAIEYRSKMFMDFLDGFCTKMLQVLNDPNMTFTIFGDPTIVRKITPKEYSYTSPANIGAVTLDYTQTICNLTDKRVYNFIGSDKLRGTNELTIILNPHNSERIVYRIYDYQMYVSNEIRNIANPALPAVHAFERWEFAEFMSVQSRVKILNADAVATVH